MKPPRRFRVHVFTAATALLMGLLPTVPLASAAPPPVKKSVAAAQPSAVTGLAAAPRRRGPLVPLRTINSPGVVVDTMATRDGQPGIRVGERFLAAPYLSVADGVGSYVGTSAGKRYAAYWQVVVLNPKNLAVVWNRTYATESRSADTGGNRSPILADLEADLAGLKRGPQDLVIATSHPATGWEPAHRLDVFEPIGYEASPDAAQPSLVAGGFSIIGNVNRTDHWAQYKWGPTAGAGRIDNLLVLDQFFAFRHVPNDRVDVDTRLATGCDPAGTNCTVRIRVGPAANDVVGQALGGAGYAVAVYDKLTLAPVRNDFFYTNGPNANAEAIRMTTFLDTERTTDVGDVVVITSLRNPGNPDHNSLMNRSVKFPVLARLAKAVASAGGTENGFNRGSLSPGTDYTVIGSVDAGSGNGNEAFGPDARVRTVMTTNEFSLFRPNGLDSPAAPQEELHRLALSAPTGTWPAVSGPALRYIGRRAGLTADPRNTYWAVQETVEFWGQRSAAVAQLEYASTSDRSEEFTEAEFNTARDQLAKELLWVQLVRQRLAAYAEPFRQLKGAEINDPAKRVADLIAEDNEREVEFDWETLMKSIVAIIAPELGKLAGHALHVTAGLVELGAWIGATSSTKPPSYESITIKADEVISQLDASAQTAIVMVDRYGDLLVSDYTKLSTVAGEWCVTTSNPESWCSAGAKEPGAEVLAALQRANERLMWTEIAPVAYGAYDLGRAPFRDLSQVSCAAGFAYPFSNTPENTRAQLMQSDEWLFGFDQDFSERQSWYEGHDFNYFQFFVMGKIKKFSPPYSTIEHPSDEILKRMFDPVPTDDNNPIAGGLGISKEAFIPTLPHNFSDGCHWVR